jgi:integrase
MVRTNIYHRQDGRWKGRIPRGKRRNGTRKFQYFFGKTREQVYEKMAQTRQFDANGRPCDKTVSELFSEWYQSIRHNIKESTASNYFLKAQKHILPAFCEYRIDNLKASDVYEFIHEKQNAGLSNRYIADIIILMKTMFKYAAKTYHIFNPMDDVTPPKKKSSEVKILDESEQKTLQTYIGEHQNRTTLCIALSLTTGIRIGELCALQWRDIDLKKRILTVRKTIQRIQCRDSETKTKLIITEPKSESSRRNIPIPECMVKFLEKYKGKSKEYLLSGTEKPVEPRTMQYRFAKILKNVNLPSVHFHALRHMFASNCVKLGFDVKALSEILGHSNVEITLNRYVHSSFAQKVAYMERVKMDF